MRIREAPRFLVDENLSPEIALGVIRRNADIDIRYIGEPGTPSKGTLDPGVLDYCERERRALITNNRKSMPAHLVQLTREGRHHWGVFEVREGVTIGDIVEEVLLLCGATDASEHIARVGWIPA